MKFLLNLGAVNDELSTEADSLSLLVTYIDFDQEFAKSQHLQDIFEVDLWV